MDGTSVFSTQFWVGKGMGRFFFSLDLMFGVQNGAQLHCENSDSLRKKGDTFMRAVSYSRNPGVPTKLPEQQVP